MGRRYVACQKNSASLSADRIAFQWNLSFPSLDRLGINSRGNPGYYSIASCVGLSPRRSRGSRFRAFQNHLIRYNRAVSYAQVAEWSIASDCKSDAYGLRRFESCPAH